MEREVQQDRQRMYNVTLRYVRITTVTVETTMRCVWCCATCHCQQYKNNECFAIFFFGEFTSMSPATLKRTLVFMWTAQYICSILTKFEFLGRFSLKYPISNSTKVHHVTCSCTDTADRHAERRDEAYGRFLLFMRTRLCRWNSCCVVRVMPWRHNWE